MVELLDLVDIDLLLRLQEKFSDLLGFNVAFAGMDSRIVGFEDRHTDKGSICNIMMSNPEGQNRCYRSDKKAGEMAAEKGTPILYRCQCYFSNFVIPIKVSDEVIGFLYGGQFFARRPGDKTDREWNALKIMRNIPDDKWEKYKKTIKAHEELEWDILKKSIGAIINTEDTSDIRSQFFHMIDDRPNDKDLRDIANNGGLVTTDTQDAFVTTFRNQSDPNVHPNRLKDTRQVLHAIKILSEIASALSDECNTKYALRTYFEISKELKRKYLYKKKLNTLYTNLCQQIDNLLMDLKRKEPSIKRIEAIDVLDRITLQIYSDIFQQELKRLSRDIWLNKYFYLVTFFRQQSKEFLKELTDKTTAFQTKVDTKPHTQKELLVKQLSDIRENHKKLVEVRPLIGPVTWILGVLGIIITIVFGLKSLG